MSFFSAVSFSSTGKDLTSLEILHLEACGYDSSYVLYSSGIQTGAIGVGTGELFSVGDVVMRNSAKPVGLCSRTRLPHLRWRLLRRRRTEATRTSAACCFLVMINFYPAARMCQTDVLAGTRKSLACCSNRRSSVLILSSKGGIFCIMLWQVQIPVSQTVQVLNHC
jgi:hypothetical protein